MRKRLVIAIVIGSAILLACYLSFHTRPKPLRPITVTWQEVGEIWGVVDLDADGNGELIVTDPRSGQLWWVQFRLLSPVRQKIPVPKYAEPFNCANGQIALFHKIVWASLVTRRGREWFLKDLSDMLEAEVTDADHDGRVNDAIVLFEGEKIAVFSRMKDGTIVERPDLPSWQADLDGDGKKDAVYDVGRFGNEVQVKFSRGLKVFLRSRIGSFAVLDMDGDKVAEIIGYEQIDPKSFRFHCWHYENGRLQRSSSQIFAGGFVSGGDTSFDIPLFRDKEGAYLVAVTREGRLMKIWEVRWRKGKWMKRLMELRALEPEIKYLHLEWTGQYWLMFTINSPPKWQEWLWDKLGQPLQRFLPFLPQPETQFSVWGWGGRGRWSLLGRWREKEQEDIEADMDGDGRKELALAFSQKVLIAKFEDGRWRTSWMKVSFVGHESSRSYSLRYGGREWVIYQDTESHRCVAIALERER